MSEAEKNTKAFLEEGADSLMPSQPSIGEPSQLSGGRLKRAFRKGSPLRLALLVLVVLAILAVPTILLGDRFENQLDGAKALEFVRAQGPWSAAVGVGLIVADLLIPLPSPAIMAALGLIYGPLMGGAIASFGSFLAALVGYTLCRAIGPRAASWIAGPKQIERLSKFFERNGMWAIAVSRFIPAVPEVLACMAGLTRMPFGRFALGNLIGSVLVGFLNAYFGARGATDPASTVAVVVVAPYVALPIFLFVLARGGKKRSDVQDVA
jgi:uncharacterized membrane protein YdjX (TVP38/TMEM64 family)